MSDRFLPQEIIRRKRDGEALSNDELDFLVAGLTDGSLTDSQAAAFAMATYFKGMTAEETVGLTLAMARSGATIDWSSADLQGPILDKHSTGGVGDKVSLILAPILAACGGYVPMISGRGLGHTGGTLDKLESIRGYNATPDLETFQKVVGDVGCAIIGQTADLAPADRRLYAIRDVTATVESIPLITASILSKKLAAGLDALVMDVKTGTGAFAASREMAAELAASIVRVANGAGTITSALITDMNQVLGDTAGNALEVAECLTVLRGEAGDPRLVDVTLALCAELLHLVDLSPSVEEGRSKAKAAMTSGRALECFGAMVAALGGPTDFVENSGRHLASASTVRPIAATRSGIVQAMDTRKIGLAVVELGGGRRRSSDDVDHSVGLSEIVQIGDEVETGQPLALVHATSDADTGRAAASLRGAIEIGEEPPALHNVVLDRVERPGK